MFLRDAQNKILFVIKLYECHLARKKRQIDVNAAS